MCGVHCALHCLLCIVCNVTCALCIVPCAVFSVRCAGGAGGNHTLVMSSEHGLAQNREIYVLSPFLSSFNWCQLNRGEEYKVTLHIMNASYTARTFHE